MILCLACRHFSPVQALYCGHCRRSFCVRRCPKGHASRWNATCCQECGNESLSESGPCLRLGCLSRLAAWALVIVGLRLLVGHAGAVAGLLGSLSGSLLTFVLGSAAEMVVGALMQVVSVLAVLLFFYCVFTVSRKKSPAPLLRGLAQVSHQGLHGLWKLSLALVKLLRRLAEGAPTRNEPK